jgi:flagellar hook-length control protein FliK
LKVLQLINPNAAPAIGSANADSVAANPLEVSQSLDEQVFDLQLLVEEAPVPGLDQLAALPLELPTEPVEVDAERWLNNMLEQHAVQIEARESDAAAPLLPVSVPFDEPAELAVKEQPAMQARVAQQLSAQDGLMIERQSQVQATRPAPNAPMNYEPSAQVQAAAPALAPLAADAVVPAPAERLSQVVQSTIDLPAASALSEGPQPHAAARPVQTLTLQAPKAQWGEQMLQSLRDSVDMQINQRIQSTTIRLDPPELGSLEIFLSHEAGRINVQLSAGNADVARLLLQTSDRLRQELIAQNFVQVNVQVSADAQGGRQHGQARQTQLADEAVQAARSDDGEQSTHQDSTSDVLVTV